MAKTSHISGVIKLIEYIDTEPEYIIIMEHMPGEVMDLWEWHSKIGPFDETITKVMFTQILKIIIDVTEAGIFHGDIKEENILINTETNEIKIIDFGLSKYISEEPYTTFTMGSSPFGTPEWITTKSYMANDATVWGMGLLLFSMLHEDLPFKNR